VVELLFRKKRMLANFRYSFRLKLLIHSSIHLFFIHKYLLSDFRLYFRQRGAIVKRIDKISALMKLMG
jgi:hypothetical protein